MNKIDIDEIIGASRGRTQPIFMTPSLPKPGGVDPLGLRQINFELMDHVWPQINNIGRHVRAYVVVSWAWRRAASIAKSLGLRDVKVDDVLDFVDRIEVIYTWSQFLKRPNSDLPGRDVISPLLNLSQYEFGGLDWKNRREKRRLSTALMAPINYGPAIKMVGWVSPSLADPRIMEPTETVAPALDAFEALISDRLDHPAFMRFGPVTVTNHEVRAWADQWDLETPSEVEKSVARDMFFGAHARKERQDAARLLAEVVEFSGVKELSKVRALMAGGPSNFSPSPDLEATLQSFRRLQTRQLFRLSLEALFYWTLLELEKRPKTSLQLASSFLDAIPETAPTTQEWLNLLLDSGDGPVSLLEALEKALRTRQGSSIAPCVAHGLAFCLLEKDLSYRRNERADRLPLAYARQQISNRKDEKPISFVQHIIESWVMAQHSYWSIGRGLADARAGGKTILRLRAVLDEDGWTLAPGAKAGNPPVPTPDRLATAMTLAVETGFIS